MELETKLVEHVEQKVEDISADDILRVEVTGSLGGIRPRGLRGRPSGSTACGALGKGRECWSGWVMSCGWGSGG